MTALQLADHILIARIGAAYGIKGWVKLISFTDPPENILNYQSFVSPQSKAGDGNPVKVEIDQSKAQGNGFIAHIRDCDDREQVRHYTGKFLYVSKEALPDLEAEEFYWHQLQGLRVVNLSNEDLGRIKSLLETGANDVLVVQGDAHSIDEQERLIPYVREQVVKQVDLEQGCIRVNWEKDF